MIEGATHLETEPSISLQVDCTQKANYAMQQNRLRVIQQITIANDPARDLHQVRIEVRDDVGCIHLWTRHVEFIAGSSVFVLDDVDLKLSPTFLLELTEKIAGELMVSLLEGDTLLCAMSCPLDLLPFDEWGGEAAYPELIASFVTPNHPDVIRLTRTAATILAEWGKEASFDGYQFRSSSHTHDQVAAIYATLQREGIAYSAMPPSFEQTGQRVRLVDTLLGFKLGNCLDLTLLYAACLEAVGIHPLLVFSHGHAFVGAWLDDQTFPESIHDDVSLLTKRLADGIHEICVVECTFVTHQNPSSFAAAEQEAYAKLKEDGQFVFVVDVARARLGKIRPLPVRVKRDDVWEIQAESPVTTPMTDAPAMLNVLAAPEFQGVGVHAKQQEWERRLLDLSLRNALLNFRGTKSTIPLLLHSLAKVEDAFALGEEFDVLPVPDDWNDISAKGGLSTGTDLIEDEFQRKRVRTLLIEKELSDRSTALYRAAKLSIEENGANTLFLALGFLKWYESDGSVKPRFAPLILVPVELVRKPSRLGFKVRRRDEDAQFNITLLEMLKQDFRLSVEGLDPLPKDEAGVDMARILTLFRHAIMNRPRWDIDEQGSLGLFSFGQFVMWNDIRTRAANLAKNLVVASLLSGKMEWEPKGVIHDPALLDSLYHPGDLMVPISADSSQLMAIANAAAGESFVLYGPPGTGKSQTITNIIANTLANGKKVLFVAEKMAALTVVESRLEQLGLGPYCLEIHSNKSNKRAVLEQFRVTLETAGMASPEDWKEKAERLAQSREALNRYSLALHGPTAYGTTAYEAVMQFERNRHAPDVIRMTEALLERVDKERIRQWTEGLHDLVLAGDACGGPHGHALQGVERTEYTVGLKSQAAEACDTYIRVLHDVSLSVERVMDAFGRSDLLPHRQQLTTLQQLCLLLQSAPDVAGSFVEVKEGRESLGTLDSILYHGQLRDELRARALTRFAPEAGAFDAGSALRQWQEVNRKWLLPRWLGQQRFRKLVKPLLLPGVELGAEAIESELTSIEQWQAEQRILDDAASAMAPLLGETVWNHGNADWSDISSSIAWRNRLHEVLRELWKDSGSIDECLSCLAADLRQGREAFLKKWVPVASFFLENWVTLESACQRLTETLSAQWESQGVEFPSTSWLESRLVRAQTWRHGLEGLREWCTWRKVRERVNGLGLTQVVEAVEQGHLQGEQVIPAFTRALYGRLLQTIVNQSEVLRSFSSRLHEDAIDRFAALGDELELITRQEIVARLSARVPKITQGVSNDSELGILLRAIRSGGRGVTLRKLFGLIPNLLFRLSPCMLMSPISVAQYLDSGMPKFDLVVFDEASQMPTCEAVGAIARGEQVIVVGDPKQLPPTSFFTSADKNSEDEDLSEDLESVLEDCLALGIPEGHLLWHYRSRHEGLIAFSNSQYYENRLLTFPSADERTPSVRRQHVAGFYDRGKSKQNQAEVEAIVAEVVRRLKDPELRKLSLGIVTFSLPQKNLVEDLLDRTMLADPELESAASQATEPIMVKNLENVQGDERDVILFSVGYGPNQQGKVSMHFGPLNREGGWRRLNVAVSRARYEMVVFSSLRPEDINVSRVHPRGVMGLRAFLEYAEKGAKSLAMSGSAKARDDGAGIEQEIARQLVEAGYAVDANVGTSAYAMDIAVVHPDRPGHYILGITCDGRSYRSANTARDRDVLRRRVLGHLGWTLHRVWSLDWWEDPQCELQKIIARIEQLRTGSTDSKVEDTAAIWTDTALTDEPQPSPPMQFGKVSSIESKRQAQQTLRNVSVGYRPVELEPVAFSGDQFLDVAHTNLIRSQILQVIDGEGPISRTLVCRRVLHAWGIQRMGNRIDLRFTAVFKRLKAKQTKQHGTVFFWPDNIDPDHYDIFRVAVHDDHRRQAEDLPVEEISCAIKTVLRSQISLPKAQMVREVVRLFGYQRSGPALEQAVVSGIHHAVASGFASFDSTSNHVILVD